MAIHNETKLRRTRIFPLVHADLNLGPSVGAVINTTSPAFNFPVRFSCYPFYGRVDLGVQANINLFSPPCSGIENITLK